MSSTAIEQNQAVVPQTPAVTPDQSEIELRTQPKKGPQELPVGAGVGDGIPQGDSMMQYLGENWPDSKLGRQCQRQYVLLLDKLEKVTEPIQLSEGSGVGSRHVVQPNEHLFRVPMGNQFPLVAGFFYLAPGGEYRKTHPEHADVFSRVPGWYVERFQRAPNPEGDDVTSRTKDTMTQDQVVWSEIRRRLD